MISLVRRQPLVATLAVAAAVLVLAIGLETGFGTRLSPAIPGGVSKPALPTEAKLLPSLAPADAEQAYPEMGTRPLFIATRRPAPPPEPVAQSTLKRGQYVLQGVIVAGDMRIAMLREKSSGRIHRVEKGREINGVRVAEITSETVTLAAGAEQEVLPLQVLKAGPLGALPATPGPFGGTPGLAPSAPSAQPGASGSPFGANPAARPGQPPAAPGAAAPQPGAPANPSAGALPQATTASMTPEELLARRRARRAQQTQ